MNRDPIERRTSFDGNRSHRDLARVDDYRTRTPSHAMKTGFRSASPSPLSKANGNNYRGMAYTPRSTSMARADSSHRYAQKDYSYGQGHGRGYGHGYGQGGGKGRRLLIECSTNAVEPRTGTGDWYGSGNAVTQADQQNAQDPSFRQHTGVPIKGAASTDLTKTTMPKHFTQPLTCFYWHKNGFCTKSDEECLYAHYYTGVVASSPVSVGGNKAVFAGRNAIEEVSQHARRETELGELEARLAAKEMELNGKLAEARTAENLGFIIQSIDQTIASGKTAAENARRALIRHREEVKRILPQLLFINDLDTGGAVLAVIDGAIGAVAGIELDFADVERQADERHGKSTSLLDSMQEFVGNDE
ncbi:hypothetical protein LTR08_008063 [Meristemomyces frigidus]|nr:hypothetical protein LTR08_008063 [Meristemomyces frigidus]